MEISPRLSGAGRTGVPVEAEDVKRERERKRNVGRTSAADISFGIGSVVESKRSGVGMK